MAGQDTAAFDQVLKEVYEGGIREMIPTKVKTYKMFEERDAKDWGGREVTYPIRAGRNQGVGAYAEGGAIPAAGRQQYTNVTIPMRYLAGRITLTKQVMMASQGAKHAFSSAMEQEQRGLVNDIASECGRMIYGDGRGVLALVNGDPGTTTTVTVDAPGGVAGATNGSRFLNPTQLVAFVTPGTGALVASSDRTIATVPAAGTTFTVTAAMAGDVADNDYIVRANKAGLTDISDTSYAKEPMGLLGMIDDGTYVATLHGVNRTTYPLYSSKVISGVGAMSADVFQRGIDLADQRGDGNIDKFLMHQSVRRAYLALTDENRRYVGGDLSKPDAGSVAAKGQELTFGGIPIMVDKYAPYGTVFGCDTSTFRRYVEIPGEWAEDGGAILHLTGTGTNLTDQYEAFYRLWQNFHIEAPNTCFRLDGVTASVVVSHID